LAGHKGFATREPAAQTPAVQPENDCADYRFSGSYRGDGVADLVDEVQKGALGLGAGLS